MKTLLMVFPHCSTGGMPEYARKKIELLRDVYDIYVVEYNNYGDSYIVQRQAIQLLIGMDHYFILSNNKRELLDIINKVNPNIIHIEERPEWFMDVSITKEIYHKEDRSYKIFETTHDSTWGINQKIFLPDKFTFVSPYSVEHCKDLGVESVIIEYPIVKKVRPNRDTALKELGLDPRKRHVLNVGLFTPRKNQGEIFEYARKLSHLDIQFHFVGNQAPNFAHYWKPLMKDKPGNCVIWGERNDVDKFYSSMDLFLFTSVARPGDTETSPIVIKEALQWDMQLLIYPLYVYMGMYDNNRNITYLDEGDNTIKIRKLLYDDVDERITVNKVNENVSVNTAESIEINNNYTEFVMVSSYPNTSSKVDITNRCIKSWKILEREILLLSHYPVDIKLYSGVDYVLYDKNNNLIKHDNYNNFTMVGGNYKYTINLDGSANQSYTVLKNYINGAYYAKSLGYKYFIATNYDFMLSEVDSTKIETNLLDMYKSRKKAVFFTFTEGDRKLYRVVYFIANVDDFINRFGHISNVDDYLSECDKVGSKNFLEDFIYHKYMDGDVLELDTDIREHFSNSGFDLCSYVEYITVLPDIASNKFICLMQISNIEDSRRIMCHIYTNNGELHNSTKHEFTSKGTQLEQYDFIDGNSYRVVFEVYDIGTDKLINVKEFSFKSLDELSINGNFIFNNTNVIDGNDINAEFDKDTNKLSFVYSGDYNGEVIVSLRDLTSLAAMHCYSMHLTKGIVYWVIPISKYIIDLYNSDIFCGFRLEFYSMDRELLGVKDDIIIKELPPKKAHGPYDSGPFDLTYLVFNDFFNIDIYKNMDINLNNLDTVIDIGASNGMFTKYMLERGAKHIYSIEPMDKSLKTLHKYYDTNARVTIVQSAISNSNGFKTMYYNDFISERSTLQKDFCNDSTLNNTIDVPTLTFGSFVNIYKIPRISLVKMDVEGSEYDIIGSLDFNNLPIIDSFLIEWHYNENMNMLDALVNKLSVNGYTVYLYKRGSDEHNKIVHNKIPLDANKPDTGILIALK